MDNAGNAAAAAEATQTGTSLHEAAEGLFEDLAASDEFGDTGADVQSTEDELEEELVDIDEEDDLEDVADDFGEDAEEDLEDDESEDGENDEEQDEGLFEVTLPGGEKAEVTLEELQAGYSRTEDYTRKRQADAEAHRQAMSEVSEVRDRYDAVLAQAEQWLRDQGPKAPDPALRNVDPGEYAAQMAEYNAFEQRMEGIGKEREFISQDQMREMEAARVEKLQAEWNQLLNHVPAWHDDAVRTKEISQLRQHGIDHLGFTAEEIDAVNDHRLLLMLKENYELRAAQSSAKKVVEKKKSKAAKRLAPGSSTKTGRNARSKKSRRRQADADQLAAQTGSVRDAAAAILLSLDD